MPPLAGRSLGLAAAILVATVACEEWVAGRTRIAGALTDPRKAAIMVASDSAHYLTIAQAFAAGDLSCSYVAPTGGSDLAHRQPLYPALLAVTMKLGGADVAALASLNLFLLVAGIWVAYAIGLRVFASPLAGAAAALAFWHVPYLYENATTRLLTEPGYALLGMLAAWGFLSYRTEPRSSTLLLTSFVLSLAYLQRVNGMFLALGALSVLAVLDFAGSSARQSAPSLGPRRVRWLGAVLVLVVATAPSWVPRTIYAGRPFYHGYLSNFLWVDDYERAHVPGPPRFTASDYGREHDAGDAIARMGYGLRRVLWNAPQEKYGSVVASAMLVGALLAVAARDTNVLAWLAVGALQIFPLAWTALSNPAQRIPATAMLPFGIVAVAAGVRTVTAFVTNVRRRRATARDPDLDTSARSPRDRSDS